MKKLLILASILSLLSSPAYAHEKRERRDRHPDAALIIIGVVSTVLLDRHYDRDRHYDYDRRYDRSVTRTICTTEKAYDEYGYPYYYRYCRPL